MRFSSIVSFFATPLSKSPEDFNLRGLFGNPAFQSLAVLGTKIVNAQRFH